MISRYRQGILVNIVGIIASTLCSLAASIIFGLYLMPSTDTKILHGYGYKISILLCFILIWICLWCIWRIGHYFVLSDKNFKRTFRHYKKIIKEINPLFWTDLGILFILLILIRLKIDPKINLQRFALIFACSGIPLIITTSCSVHILYRKWVLRREESIITALANNSGLMLWSDEENKDSQVYDNLFSLKNCNFIFIWAIHFSQIIGRDNKNSLFDLRNLINQNPYAQIYIMLQCPFCEAVIERSIELNYPYDENYVNAPIETISNCLAQKSNRLKIVLRHGEPYFRTILWGTKSHSVAQYNPLSLSNAIPCPHTLDTPEERFLSTTGYGGFIVQRYPPGKHGSQAPLIKGTVSVHGGMWNSLRMTFIREFEKGIRLQEPLNQSMMDTLICLACDLKISKEKIKQLKKESTSDQLVNLIQREQKWDDFFRRINDSAHTKAAILDIATTTQL